MKIRDENRPVYRSILQQMAVIALDDLTGKIGTDEAVEKIMLLEATHKIELDEEIRNLGLDVTPWGRQISGGRSGTKL